jgi:hypothetical protein
MQDLADAGLPLPAVNQFLWVAGKHPNLTLALTPTLLTPAPSP